MPWINIVPYPSQIIALTIKSTSYKGLQKDRPHTVGVVSVVVVDIPVRIHIEHIVGVRRIRRFTRYLPIYYKYISVVTIFYLPL